MTATRIFILVIGLILSGTPNVGLSQDSNSAVDEIEKASFLLRREAAELFAVKLQNEITAFHRCEISSEWYSYTVDEKIARMELELRVHANLTAPTHGFNLSTVLDPNVKFKDIFCSDSTYTNYIRSKLSSIENKNTVDNDEFLVAARRRYSFPIFNNSYTKAILVSNVIRTRWSKPNWTGYWEDTDVIEIYAKKNGKWEYAGIVGESNSDGMTKVPE
jgi:hypothetical protein